MTMKQENYSHVFVIKISFIFYSFNIRTDTLYFYQLFTTVTVDEPAPGLKTILSFKFPDQRSGKVSDVICKFGVMIFSFCSIGVIILNFCSSRWKE